MLVPAPAVPLHPGPYRTPPQRSLADMANAQLRRDKKDALAQGVEDATSEDCLRGSGKDGAVGGLLRAPIVAAQALAGRCPK